MKPLRLEDARRLVAGSAVAGAGGLALTAVGAGLDLRRTLFSYLTAFTFWLGIALGALLLLMVFHATRARWPVVLRRVLEVVPLTLPLFAVLFLAIVAGLGQLYGWVEPGQASGEARRLWEHRRAYLNVPFFLIRAAGYFAVWTIVGQLLYTWSVRQDREGGTTLTVWQRRLGAGGLPLVALTVTFAAFDWLMSLEAHIASTIFGVYFFAGGFVAAIAVLILLAQAAQRAGLLGEGLSPDHRHSLGKLLFAFVCFWAYIAFSQYMLTWIADLPHEVPWYLARQHGGWGPVAILLVIGHFALPFFLLLSRDLKRRAGPLAAVAIWVLALHYVDVYWLVMPLLDRAGPHPRWTDLTALAGIGALALAFGIWRLSGQLTQPAGDPYLEDSLRYEPP